MTDTADRPTGTLCFAHPTPRCTLSSGTNPAFPAPWQLPPYPVGVRAGASTQPTSAGGHSRQSVGTAHPTLPVTG